MTNRETHTNHGNYAIDARLRRVVEPCADALARHRSIARVLAALAAALTVAALTLPAFTVSLPGIGDAQTASQTGAAEQAGGNIDAQAIAESATEEQGTDPDAEGVGGGLLQSPLR